MSALEHINEGPRESRFLDGHGFANIVLASLGCLAAFRNFGAEAALLVSGWWCLSLLIINSDLRRFIIPNWATAGIAILGFAYALVSSPAASMRLSEVWFAVAPSFGRAVSVFLGIVAFAWVFAFITKREGVGFGDVKLSGALAVWLNAYDLLLTLELACFAALGLVAICYFRDRRTFGDGVIPFGAFLAPAAWIVFLANHLGTMSDPWRNLLG